MSIRKTVKKAASKAKQDTAPVIVYHNTRCSKSRGVCELLEKKKVRTEIVEYLHTPPTKDELKDLLKKLGIKAADLVRRNEPIYREKYEGKKLTEAQWIAAMVKDPILIERPIIVKGDRAVIGRPEERVLELLKEG